MSEEERIEAFLAEGPWAVAGASASRAKFGNKVLRCYMRHEKTPVYPLNPKEKEIEGLQAYSSLLDVPDQVRALSIITPPGITERVVEDAAAHGVKHVWMQPGAESEAAIARAEELGLSVIAGGACLLVVLG